VRKSLTQKLYFPWLLAVQIGEATLQIVPWHPDFHPSR
jgi:hypothetical protein